MKDIRIRHGIIVGIALALVCAGAPAAAQANGVGSQFELAFWQAVANSEDAAQYEAYLAQYPQGTFAPIARLKIAALRGTAVAAPPVAVGAQTLTPAWAAAAAPVSVDRPPAPPQMAAAVVPASAPPQPVQVIAAPQLIPAATPAQRPLPAAPVSDDRAALMARTGAIESGTPAAASLALPAIPQMAQVPPVPIPPTFCSALDRNSYHDNVYRPARRVAQENNRAATAYLRELQALYDGFEPQRDFERMNLIADAAQAYEPIADDTYDVTVSYDSLFERLMAVRIVDCGSAGQ